MISDEPEHYSYNEVSEMSEVTQESYPEGYDQKGIQDDLVDFEKLVEATQNKLEIKESEQDPNDHLSDINEECYREACDEFLRNFFIKFGMKKTLDSF